MTKPLDSPDKQPVRQNPYPLTSYPPHQLSSPAPTSPPETIASGRPATISAATILTGLIQCPRHPDLPGPAAAVHRRLDGPPRLTKAIPSALGAIIAIVAILTKAGDAPAAFAWAQRRVFRSDRLHTEVVLDLTNWDGSPFEGGS
jgi:hypothetical protein